VASRYSRLFGYGLVNLELAAAALRTRALDKMLRLGAVRSRRHGLRLTNGQYNLGVTKNWSIAEPQGGGNPVVYGRISRFGEILFQVG
jgi:hypothetical protein